MPASDLKITALTAIGANPVNPATFPMPMVDLLDNSMAASGTTKKVTVNQILGAGGTATLASATITGAATVGTTLGVTGVSTLASAVVTGDLTVDTSTLKVDSANDRVGIGTASPASGTKLDVAGFVRGTSGAVFNGASNIASGAGLEIGYSTGGQNGFLQAFDRSGNAYKAIRLIGSSIDFDIANTVKATIDAAGNVGVGVTPSAWYSQYSVLQVGIGASISSYNSTYYDNIQLACNYFANSSGADRYINNGYATQYFQYQGSHIFRIAGNNTSGANQALTWTPAMTLDASGTLLVGTATTSVASGGVVTYGSSVAQFAIGHATGTPSGTAYAGLQYAGAEIGSIKQSGTTAVLYNTTSDYRLKESVKPLNGGLARVNALKPSVYNWKSDGSTGEGFLAHELAEVVPFAVSGEKDAMNADGTIKSQGIDMSRVVPILVAAIQELTARVQTLESR